MLTFNSDKNEIDNKKTLLMFLLLSLGNVLTGFPTFSAGTKQEIQCESR